MRIRRGVLSCRMLWPQSGVVFVNIGGNVYVGRCCYVYLVLREPNYGGTAVVLCIWYLMVPPRGVFVTC